jgi:hypothetical protein
VSYDDMVEELVAQLPDAPANRRCPDDGTCHHGCPADPGVKPCFRVRHCAPFSSYGQWKDTDR